LIEQDAREFFTDEKVLERLEDPKTYFQKISTVAFKPVSFFLQHIWKHKNNLLALIFTKITNKEKDLPFAYSILNHGNIGLLEALLSTIFRPHNSFCIYIDAKSSEKYKVFLIKLNYFFQIYYVSVYKVNKILVLWKPAKSWLGESIIYWNSVL